MPPREEPIDRFRPKWKLSEEHIYDETPCWEWAACKNEHGYGEFWIAGKRMLAHRFSYQHYREPIPDGLRVLHQCDNPPCVNPAHLFVGTQADNMKDMAEKGRARGGQQNRLKTHCPRGHPYDYVDSHGERHCRICRRKANARRYWEAKRRAA